MTKKAKVLFFLLLVALLLIIYLVLTSESAKPANKAEQSAKNKTFVLAEESYKTEIKTVFSAYERSSQDNNFTIDHVIALRNKLLALKGLPAKFKELHLKLVLSLDRMENYLKQNDQQGKNESQIIISQLKADYSWLNN